MVLIELRKILNTDRFFFKNPYTINNYLCNKLKKMLVLRYNIGTPNCQYYNIKSTIINRKISNIRYDTIKSTIVSSKISSNIPLSSNVRFYTIKLKITHSKMWNNILLSSNIRYVS